jgi:hypothetical protein
METLISICVGIGLSAACGFRVFVPLFIISLASATGHLHLVSGFDWIGSVPALIAFGVATATEIAAYYVPGLDHLLDTITTPAAVAAGTVITASFVHDLSPFLKWTLALIAGGGAAGTVQAVTVMTRSLSMAGSGGLANPLVSTVELGGSILTSLLALLIPVAVVVGLVGLAVIAGYTSIRRSPKAPGAINQKMGRAVSGPAPG